MKLSIVLCARNQRDTILNDVEQMRAATIDGWEVERVVVDNHSTDGTRDVLHTLKGDDLVVVYQPRTYGILACWQAALTHLTGDYVLLPHHASHLTLEGLPDLLQATDSGAAAIYSAANTNSPFRRDTVTWLVNALYNCDLIDVIGATKVFRADVLKALNLSGSNMGVDVDVTLKLLRAGMELEQVQCGIQESPRPKRGAVMAGLVALLKAQLLPSPVWKPGRQST